MTAPRPDPLTDRRGVNAVEAVFINEFNWAFREQAISDYGIDAQAEIFEFGKPTGKLIALQIKTGRLTFASTERTISSTVNDGTSIIGSIIRFRFSSFCTTQTGTSLFGKRSSGTLPGSQTRVGRSSCRRPTCSMQRPKRQSLTGNPHRRSVRYRRARMAMDIDLMTLLAERKKFTIEIEHWTNKSLGMRGIAVMFDECYKEITGLRAGLDVSSY